MNSKQNRILVLGGEGYIGKRLTKSLRSKGHTVFTADRSEDPSLSANYLGDYDTLGTYCIRDYGTIILLAGHSSVAMCTNDPIGSFENNVGKFIRLTSKLSSDQRFIYASSASLYNGMHPLMDEYTPLPFNSTTHYDFQKRIIDEYMKFSKLQYFGLRFGTVCGFSPNLRTDVMINKMVKTAKDYGEIRMSNAAAIRPILGMNDLCRAVKAIIDHPNPERGVWNVSSFNSNIGTIAQIVSMLMGVPVVRLPDSLTYNMGMSNAWFGNKFNFCFRETCESIVQDLLDKWDKVEKFGERV